MKVVYTLFLCVMCVCSALADELSLTVAHPFKDNAVLQREIKLPVWGTSTPGASITVSFENQTQSTKTDEQGNWKLFLDPLTAVKLKSENDVPTGKELKIDADAGTASSHIVLTNLVVGDVWLCSGQSNMAGKLRNKPSAHHPSNTVAIADYPGYRFTLTQKDHAWLVCSPETAPEFKRTAFFFGRKVYQETLIPIGLMAAAVGGSKIETWLNQKPYEVGGNYSKHIDHVVGYGLKGLVWYQGESNAKGDKDYTPMLTSLITGWRAAWGQGDFPAYFVQLPGYGEALNEMGGKRAGWPKLRHDQFETLAVKNTGMAITIDIGDANVHPPNKVDTGLRLAHAALHQTYDMTNIAGSGPLYKSHRIDGETIRVSFDFAENGLMVALKEGFLPPVPTPQASIGCAFVQDQAGEWHLANAIIDGAELVVSAEGVKQPTAVRYAYLARPAGSLLYNKDGLPAAPFATDIKPGTP